MKKWTKKKKNVNPVEQKYVLHAVEIPVDAAVMIKSVLVEHKLLQKSGEADKMAKVTVYSTPTCPWCKKTKEFLNTNNIEFENKDVSSDDAAKKTMIDKSGQMGVPVTDIDGTIIVGFDTDKIKSALGI